MDLRETNNLIRKQLHFEERQVAIGEMIAKLLKESGADQQSMVMKNRRKES